MNRRCDLGQGESEKQDKTENESTLEEDKEAVRTNIEFWEERVKKRLQEIDKILAEDGLDLKKIEAQQITVAALVHALNDLDAEAGSIIDAHRNVKSDLANYHQAVLRAREMFRRIADNLEKQAAEKKSTFLKEAYADFVREALDLARPIKN